MHIFTRLSLPKFLRNSRKEKRAIRCNNIGRTYENTLKEIAVLAILTAEDINDTIHVIVDYRVGKC